MKKKIKMTISLFFLLISRIFVMFYYTAIAIGPNYVEDCEPIVKKLRNL